MITLDDKEFYCICMLAQFGAKSIGEDIIGGLIKYGGLYLLKEEELIEVAHMIDSGAVIFDLLRRESIDKIKQNKLYAQKNI